MNRLDSNVEEQILIKAIQEEATWESLPKWLTAFFHPSLKAWKLLPEDKYLRSGWELELAEAEAKDSEDSENIKGDPELLSATNGPLEINRHFPSINSEATTQQGDLELYPVSKAPVEVNGRFPSINSEASIPQTTLENNVNALGNGAPEVQSRVVELAGSQEVKKSLGGPDVKTLKVDCHLESTSRKSDIGAAQLGHMGNEIKNGEPNKWVEQGYENGNGNNARDLNTTCSNKDVGTGQDDMLSVGHGANQLDIHNLGQSEVRTPGIAAFEATNENSNTKKRKYNPSVGGIVQTMEGLTPSRAGKKDGSSALKSFSRVKRWYEKKVPLYNSFV